MVVGDRNVGSPGRTDGKDSCRGVSLIELLVVIAIVAVVIGLLPVINQFSQSNANQAARADGAGLAHLDGSELRPGFDLGDLRALTRACASSARVAERLVRWLDLAAQAEARQDEALRRWLIHRYITTLEKVSGPLVPSVQADALMNIARTL
jgi:prepilin-type N-terminal cleavage/methylation domain-containing protein